MFFDIHKDTPDDKIKEMQILGYRWSVENDRGCYLSFSGFADDPREIYEIPEAVELCKKLIKMGFISVLHPFSLMDEDGKPRDPGPHPFGAFEIWATVEGLFSKDGEVEMSSELIGRFYQDLQISNLACEKTVAGHIDAGQHRHGVLLKYGKP